MMDPAHADQAWRGLAALSGSWIGGGANFAAIGRNFELTDAMFGVMVVVDVAVANVWMAALLFFADRSRSMDARIGANRTTVDDVQARAEAYAAKVAAPTDLPALLTILALCLGGAMLADLGATWLFRVVPEIDLLGRFAWKIVLVTAFGLLLSFTPVRQLEGKGASRVGSVFLYLLIASIGAKAHFAQVFTPQNLPLIAIGALWMVFHAAGMLWVRRRLKAPIFFRRRGLASLRRRRRVGPHRRVRVQPGARARRRPARDRGVRGRHVRGAHVRARPAFRADAVGGVSGGARSRPHLLPNTASIALLSTTPTLFAGGSTTTAPAKKPWPRN